LELNYSCGCLRKSTITQFRSGQVKENFGSP
jgi:hypothetical protein